jgi:hypothetical protein
VYRLAGLLAVTLLSGFVAALLANTSSAEAGGNCQAKLVGNSYDCNEKFSTGELAGDCVQFTMLSGFPNNFSLTSGNFGKFLCACDATGSFNSPSFDASPSAFECVSGDAIEFNGALKSKKLRGQTMDSLLISGIFVCTLRSSLCS